MPRNGSGQYTLPAGNPAVTGTTISSSGWANPTLSDIASALTASISVDGQTVPTANLPMGNFRHTGVANAQNANEYATVNQIQSAGLALLGGATVGSMSLTGLTITGSAGLTLGNQTSPNVSPIKFGDGSGWQLKFQTTGGTTVATLQDNGNFSAANVTITSDERIKGEWEALPADFLERLCSVKSGTYRRVDIESDARHVGVTAQSLQEVLPEAVLEGNGGMLSVAYGNAALVACIELAREVVRLRAIVEAK